MKNKPSVSNEKRELIESLRGMVEFHCGDGKGWLYAWRDVEVMAMETLEKHGLVKITSIYGSSVFGIWRKRK